MKPSAIRDEFVRLCKDYSDKCTDAYSEIDIQKKFTAMTLSYRVIKAEVVYVEKGNTFVPTSTLFCRIYPSKNRCVSKIMPDIFGHTGINESRRAPPFPERAVRATAADRRR